MIQMCPPSRPPSYSIPSRLSSGMRTSMWQKRRSNGMTNLGLTILSTTSTLRLRRRSSKERLALAVLSLRALLQSRSGPGQMIISEIQ